MGTRVAELVWLLGFLGERWRVRCGDKCFSVGYVRVAGRN